MRRTDTVDRDADGGAGAVAGAAVEESGSMCVDTVEEHQVNIGVCLGP